MRKDINKMELEPRKLHPMNLQLFATSQKDGDDGNDSDGDDDDDPDDDDADDDDPDDDDPDGKKGGSDGQKKAGKDGAKKKTYTEDEVNKLVEKRLARERRKMAKQKDKDADDDAKKGGKDSAGDDAKTKAAVSRAEKLEIKLACYEAGVSKDAVDDVAALARAYMEADEDLDFEDAIEKVVKKYPQFTKAKKNSDDDEDEDDGDDDKGSGSRSKAWSSRQKGTKGAKLSGVERQFYELNPSLRPKD